MSLIEPYLDALLDELEDTFNTIEKLGLTLSTVYIGGGTPTTLSPIQLEKLLSLDNESFTALAKTIAEAAGANKARTEAIVSNPELLKRKLSQISPEEAKSLIDAAGKEKSEEIMNLLNERGVDLGR